MLNCLTLFFWSLSSSIAAVCNTGEKVSAVKMKPSCGCLAAVRTQGWPTACSPTPANKQVDDKVSVLREDHDKQSVEVQTLNQQPKEVGHDEVLEKHQKGFTSHLENTKVQNP